MGCPEVLLVLTSHGSSVVDRAKVGIGKTNSGPNIAMRTSEDLKMEERGISSIVVVHCLDIQRAYHPRTAEDFEKDSSR